jgi:hypothetical protein
MREDRLPVASRAGLAADAPTQLLGFRAAEPRETGNDGVKLFDRPRVASSDGKPSPSDRFVVAPIFACDRSCKCTHSTVAFGQHPDSNHDEALHGGRAARQFTANLLGAKVLVGRQTEPSLLCDGKRGAPLERKKTNYRC